MKKLSKYEENILIRNKIVGYSTKFKDDILNLFKITSAAAENTIKKYNNCKQARNINNKITIQKIFEVYWNDFRNKYAKQIVRPAIDDNINALLTCGNFDFGYLYYECQNQDCNNFHLQPFTCKSRFCPSCGKKYNDARSIEISRKCLDIPHRHIVFTISERLRSYIQKDRILIDCLFEAVNLTFKFMAYKASKHKKYKFGFIQTLHTFGRDMKFNPHIHALVAEALIDKNNNIKPYYYFHYEQIRKSFQKCLLDLMSKHVKDKDFKKVKDVIYQESNKGFYVHGPKLHKYKNKESNKKLINYIVRYAGHPAISQSRIIKMDYTTNIITYYYDPHEDDGLPEGEKQGRQYVTEHVYEFIKKLIVHIPDNGKHNIRYYGFYSNKEKHKKLTREKKGTLFSSIDIYVMRKNLKFRERIISSFDYDILMCEKCGKTLTISYDMCFIPKNTKRKINYG